MATRTISVTTRAQLAAGSNPNGYGDDVTITNTGTATAYLDSDQPDSTTAGQPLTAGSSVTWSKGQPLWTVAPVATTLVVSENSGALFDAGAIASQILSQGLAAQIATAINVQGVPAIESATILLNASILTPANTNPGFGGVPIDCSRYQSLRLFCSDTYAVGGTFSSPRPFVVNWYADAAGTIPVGQDAWNSPTGTNGGLYTNYAGCVVSVPCRGPFFDIVAQSVNVGPSTAGLVVIGSYRPAQDLKWQQITNGFAGTSGFVTQTALGNAGGTFSYSGAFPVGAYDEFPLLPGGDCMSMLAVGTTTAPCTFQIRDTYSNRFVYTRTVPAVAAPGFGITIERLVLPNSPIKATITIAGATTSVNWTLVGVDRA